MTGVLDDVVVASLVYKPLTHLSKKPREGGVPETTSFFGGDPDITLRHLIKKKLLFEFRILDTSREFLEVEGKNG